MLPYKAAEDWNLIIMMALCGLVQRAALPPRCSAGVQLVPPLPSAFKNCHPAKLFQMNPCTRMRSLSHCQGSTLNCTDLGKQSRRIQA